MIAIIMSGMQKLPESCDDCIYFASRPHPFKGWTDLCELCVQCLDDDQPDGWIYGGDNRPKNCPLIDLEAIQADQTQNKWHDLRKVCKAKRVEAKPIRHGHWIEPSDSMTISCICSECNWESHYYEDDVNGMPYCPNCGAKMDEVEECQN